MYSGPKNICYNTTRKQYDSGKKEQSNNYSWGKVEEMKSLTQTKPVYKNSVDIIGDPCP